MLEELVETFELPHVFHSIINGKRASGPHDMLTDMLCMMCLIKSLKVMKVGFD